MNGKGVGKEANLAFLPGNTFKSEEMTKSANLVKEKMRKTLVILIILFSGEIK